MTTDIALGPTQRQRELMDIAADLFARRGYHRVAVSEISAALGLTGPAFYRHYRSKEAVLVALLDDAVTGHLEDLLDLARRTPDPRERLEGIVTEHVRFVLDRSAAVAVWRTEFLCLPAAERRRLRLLQVLCTDEWVRAVASLRSELDVDQIRAMCHATMALIRSPTEVSDPFPRQQLEPLLNAVALHTLRVCLNGGTSG